MKIEESTGHLQDGQGNPIPVHVPDARSQSTAEIKRTGPRQKRWAPKVTTGCKTCRARRIKCDEAKPHCKQCISRGRWCEYATPSPPAVTDSQNKGQHSEDKKPTPPISPQQIVEKWRLQSQSQSPGSSKSPELKPPGWDIVEGVRYLFEVMAPEHLSNSLGSSDFDNQFVGPPTIIIEHSFLMVVTAHRIKTACRKRGVLPAPDQLVSLAHIWARFYFHMTHSLDRVNRLINSPEPAIGVFYRIMDILHVELTLLSPTWRPHIEGCATLIRLYGGVLRVLDLSEGGPSPILAIQLILIIATMANTTSPATDQIQGFASWTTPELCAVYSKTMYSEMPCPTHLFLNIIQINRLRTQLAATVSYKDVIWPLARDIFVDIERFSPENWIEPYPVPQKPEMVLVGKIFKTAVTLYGVLSLPPPPMSSPPPAEGDSPQTHETPTAASYQKTKVAIRDKLMRQACQAMDIRPTKIYLSWPLAVLGVALVDGKPSDQATIEDYLRKISVAPQSYCGPTITLNKLKAFWASGKTGWEDCFDEPCPVLA
ncbi:hypothetical protein QQS21_008228 [Conoideocrella luteorostrata]|uniref:Zn(2)-C6 fungal-type domain-containing protein n=1 Tax=Conoideocrella luteorostrata TaxID=1105319 RepID=A0AAJ0CLZ7_9HYPO|nr:hypothetical protein QQS21_008228 [Conoideocrella luteorostrata]